MQGTLVELSRGMSKGASGTIQVPEHWHREGGLPKHEQEDEARCACFVSTV